MLPKRVGLDQACLARLRVDRFSGLGTFSGAYRGIDSPICAANSRTFSPRKSFAVTIDLRKLADLFELLREPDETSDDGRPCYVVSFRPRQNARNYDSRKEKVMSQLAGRFWLGKDDLSIARSEGSLTRAVPVAWVASVYQLSFDYRAQTLPGTNTTMPARFTLDLGVKAPFYHARQLGAGQLQAGLTGRLKDWLRRASPTLVGGRLAWGRAAPGGISGETQGLAAESQPYLGLRAACLGPGSSRRD